ncbi:MAG TPA: MOSC N-terminal beta barrel domain-containing protein [Candidatus Acidoferrales bacterium]|nr:MOSC N-terminal beta barrel domain-containing protein [Candidatus Acidoferrales bacterium]
MEKLGTLQILRRYPIKSMAGEDLPEIFVTFAGLIGDRAYAFVDKDNRSSFPWMTARQAHEMLLFRPRYVESCPVTNEHPSRECFRAEVSTPDGKTMSVDDPEFTPFFEKRFGRQLELRFSERAMQDACPVSLLGLDTVEELARETGMMLDHRRFRANFYIAWDNRKPYFEDELAGARLQIGEKLALMIVKKDTRCVIITLDPSSAEASPQVFEAVTKNHDRCFGVYASVIREGAVRTGDPVFAA